jgi:hypothetical protein
VPAGAAAGAAAAAKREPRPPRPPRPPREPRQRRGGGSAGGGDWLRRHAKPLAGLLALLLVAVVAVVLLGGSNDKKPTVLGQPIDAKLGPVPTNRVTGNGTASLRLDGRKLTVSITTARLLDGAPHALHIHAGGKGTCPPASAASLHNGNLSLATHQGGPFYGPPVQALTTHGDTSVKSIISFSRYPKTSNVAYKRTMTVTPIVASYLRKDNAVVVVHGIDYNKNGIYDGVLERSDLDRSLTGESTAPALCGPLKAGKDPGKSTTTASVRRPGASGTHVFTASLSVAPATAGRPLYCALHPPFSQT